MVLNHGYGTLWAGSNRDSVHQINIRFREVGKSTMIHFPRDNDEFKSSSRVLNLEAFEAPESSLFSYLILRSLISVLQIRDDSSSPVNDYQLSYDLLLLTTRWVPNMKLDN